MATTVNKAFDEFMTNTVNLDPKVVSEARKSRDNLLDNIADFSQKDGFFRLWKTMNIQFGSFARKTKCRELDDIDLMICISADGATYDSFSSDWNNIHITASNENEAQQNCMDVYGYLNSTKVLNMFKKKLENVAEYSHSEINKRGEAIVLNLKSKDWSFDIVPCFHTVVESNGRAYYLIPNGNGNWKKTDPEKDRDHVTKTNSDNDGKVLELIRLCKKWNQVNNTKTMPSYLLETMIINYCDSTDSISPYIDIRFRETLKYISDNIYNNVNDLKDIQGNINDLSIYEKYSIQQKAKTDYDKACSATDYEITQKDMKNSVSKWGEIFGSDFPKYG